MIQNIIKNKYQIIELIIIFIITFLFNLTCNTMGMDEIWNYGFSYNIANGLIPYKDFNMVITPLFPILGAIFLSIFGKNLYIYHIFNSIICTMLFYNMKKKCPKSYYIPYSIFLFFSLPNYNVFSILLLYILIRLENKSKNDYIIGIILGLTFLTKQNIGIFLCFPTLFIKDVKRIFKRVIGFIIPNIVFLVYLLYNDALYNFIDYTILGIQEFALKNQNHYFICIIIIIVSMAYLVYQYIKNKNIEIIYLVCFQLLLFPMTDVYHTIIAILPTLVYFLSKLKLNKKIITFTFAIFMIFIFSINIYNYYKGNLNYPNNTNKYQYRKISFNEENAINIISDYIKSTDDELYIISIYAYLFKIENDIPINKYDLLINGNIGKNNLIKITNEINNNCSKKKCTFIVESEKITQKSSIYSEEIINYIVNTYNQKEKIKNTNFFIFQNY